MSGKKDAMTYHQFLESKMVIARQSGFRVSPEEVHPALKPHQRDAVIWAVQGGKRALFESFGLGKYDPFGGLMTVPVEAVKLGREGIGTELNPDYFRDGVGYMKAADAERDTPTLFDLINAKEDTNHDDA